jgi:hypothetical protein
VEKEINSGPSQVSERRIFKREIEIAVVMGELSSQPIRGGHNQQVRRAQRNPPLA